MASLNERIAVSAPGKVLFAGGFLVLDRQHSGLVFGLNARIHVLIQKEKSNPLEVSPSSCISVESPQFQEARWLYQWLPAGRDELSGTLKQDTTEAAYTSNPNPFVQTALEYALTYLTHTHKLLSPSHLKITILADNSYYTTSESPTSTAPPADSSRFTNFNIPLHSAHKTGLGSSAALVTSLTAALLTYFSPASTQNQKLIHNLAQASHCAAQGKVGSGFDVAAAVYGSCLYRRFSPTILSSLGDAHSPGFSERLHLCIEDLNPQGAVWDVEISSAAVEIPKSLMLLMCDVDCGSQTPGMVKKVLAWRAAKPQEALLLWSALQTGTDELCGELTRLAKLDLGAISMEEQKKLGDIIQTIRALVRDMSAKSDVPIEPPVITELLDYCTDLPGVIGGVAPGAGGYDAVALLVRNDGGVVRNLEERLEGWKSKVDGASIGRVSLLKAKQAYEGTRVEDWKMYEGWVGCGEES